MIEIEDHVWPLICLFFNKSMLNGKMINIPLYLEYSTFEKQGVGDVQRFPGTDTGQALEATGF